MPRFAVIVSQYVEEVASVVVEAKDEEAATKQVEEIIEAGGCDLDWHDGNSVKGAAEVVDIHRANDDEELTDVD